MTKINEDPKDVLIRQFQKEIVELRAQLSDGRFLLWLHPFALHFKQQMDYFKTK